MEDRAELKRECFTDIEGRGKEAGVRPPPGETEGAKRKEARRKKERKK